MLAAMRGLAIAMVLVLTGTAGAQPVSSGDGMGDQAAVLFVRGRELKQAGRISEACELFDRSYRIDPAPGTALNLADCLELQGEVRRAWELFDHVARNPQNGPARVQLGRQRADALMIKLATVIVALGDPRAVGLVVRLGDRELSPAPSIRVITEPGELALVATVPGQPAFTAAVHAVAGAAVSVDVPALHDAATLRRRRLRYFAGGIGAVGLASLGVSLGFAIAARRANDDAFDHGCAHTPGGVVCTAGGDGVNDGKRLLHLAGARADLATGFAIGGAALVGAATTVFLSARETAAVAPIAGAHALGLGIVGRF
jgi:hypothetical protein